jgi:hypothetical protein
MLLNTMETGVASGTAVTTTNSDDDGGSTYTPTKANSGLMTFDNTHVHRGALALLVDATAGITAVSRADITSGNADETIDVYIWMDNLPATAGALVCTFVTAGSNVRIVVNTTGTVTVFNSAGTSLFTSTNSLVTGGWNRLAMRCAVAGGGGTAGTIRVEIYKPANAETTTPTETYAPTPGTSTTGAVSTISTIRVGKADSSSTFKGWFDDMARDQGVNNVAPRVPPTGAISKAFESWPQMLAPVVQGGATITGGGPMLGQTRMFVPAVATGKNVRVPLMRAIMVMPVPVAEQPHLARYWDGTNELECDASYWDGSHETPIVGWEVV